MELVNVQTFGFMVAFLFVAFAALVRALWQRLPNENMRRSTKTKKENIRCSTKKKIVPHKHEDHDQPSLHNRQSTPREQSPLPDRTTMQMAVTQLTMSHSVDTPTFMPKATTQPLVIPIQQQPEQENIRRSTKRKKKNMRRSNKTMTVPVNHKECDQTSLRNRRSTPGTQTQPPDRTTAQTAVTRLPMPTSMETTPSMSPTSTPKATTSLARPLKPTPRALKPLDTPTTPTQRAPSPSARPCAPAPRTPTLPARAPTPPHFIPLQQPDMAQQRTVEQENKRRLTKRKKKNMRRSAKTMTVPDNHEEQAQKSLRNRRPKPETQTQPPDRTTTQTAVTRLPMSPTMETPPLMPPTSTAKATTPLAGPLRHTPSAPTSPVRATTTTPTAFTPLATSTTPKQRAPTPQDMPSTSAPRSPTHPARAPTSPFSIPIQQQQSDMAQQLTMEQEGLKLTPQSSEIVRKIIVKNFVNLKQYMHPDPIIDCKTGFNLLTDTDRRNIKDKDIIEKKHTILKNVISKGVNGYTDFKERLKKTFQTRLLQLLICAERGHDTKEIEGQLQENAVFSAEYIKLKLDLKQSLITFYKTRHSHVYLSPLFEEKETSLAYFYIRPELNAVVSPPARNDERHTNNDKKIPVKSLSEMFKTGNEDNREIYLLADAGLGKSAFSKYLANVWCQAHCPDEDMNKFLLKDIDCIQKFDFLFLVLLRDAGNSCSIDELIFEKIVSELGVEELLSKCDLRKILKNEKCLVILDGLDEWIHPENECKRSPRSIPHRNDRGDCTILTTTRPWTLGILNLNSCQLGNKIEMTKLSKDSSKKLTSRIIRRLKSHTSEDALQNDVKKFRKEIKNRKLAELTSVPLLLIYTICLWCGGVEIRNSKCNLYTNIVEFLLSRTIQIHGERQQLCDLPVSNILECFAEYDICTKYYQVLVHLGELAYETLFNETRENTLVFKRSVAEKYLTPDEMKFTLHSGMLSESTTKGLIKIVSKVSFSHKTVQEFFAAIFISSENEAQTTVLKKCRNIQDILNMSITCEFISGMNANRMCVISNDLMSVINEDEETSEFRKCTGDRVNDLLYNIQKMFMSCLQEMPESENIQLCLQDFFIHDETWRSEQLQRLSKQNKTNIKSLYIRSYHSRSLRKIVDLFSLKDLSHIQKLYHEGDCEQKAEIDLILFPSLQNISLFHGLLPNAKEIVSEILPRLQNLQYLYIEDFQLPHIILTQLFYFMSDQKSMKELIMGHLYCEEHGDDCCGWYIDLSQLSTLTTLRLFHINNLRVNASTPSLVNVMLWTFNLYKGSVFLSSEMLNIERVDLYRMILPAESLQNFMTVLENLPQSVTVEMDKLEPETEYERVKENIRRSQSFHVIEELFGTKIEFETRKPSEV